MKRLQLLFRLVASSSASTSSRHFGGSLAFGLAPLLHRNQESIVNIKPNRGWSIDSSLGPLVPSRPRTCTTLFSTSPQSRSLRFLEAVSTGDLELVKKICREGEGKDGKANSADESLVKAVDGDGNRALHLAVASQNLQMIKYVVEELQANLEDKADSTEMTALELAVQGKNLEMTQYLLEKGCQLGDWALDVAVKGENLAMIMCLMENGCNDDAGRSKHATDVLHATRKTRNIEILAYLVETCRGNVNVLDEDGESLLTHAIAAKNVKVVRYLLNNSNVDIEVRGDWYQKTPFMLVCEKFSFELVQWFWNTRRPNVECLDFNSGTPLLHFSWRGRLEVVKWLVETCGAQVNATDWMGHTALHNAVSALTYSRVQRLLGAEDCPHAVRFGSDKECVQIVEYLLDNCPINVNAANNEGQTALHLACNQKFSDTLDYVRPLVKAGIYVNTQDKKGRTALHYACKLGQLPAVQYLLDQGGVNASIVDMEGRTAFRLVAESAKSEDVGELLQLLASRVPPSAW